MQLTVGIENIDELRRQQGIDDVELREGIRDLAVGDFVRLTLLTDTKEFKEFAGKTVLVRITSIRGYTFRGKLASEPGAGGSADLAIGSSIVFTTAHIHSLVKGLATDE